MIAKNPLLSQKQSWGEGFLKAFHMQGTNIFQNNTSQSVRHKKSREKTGGVSEKYTIQRLRKTRNTVQNRTKSDMN